MSDQKLQQPKVENVTKVSKEHLPFASLEMKNDSLLKLKIPTNFKSCFSKYTKRRWLVTTV